MCLSDASITQIAEITEGVSFAYLKELFLSAMMQWITEMKIGSMEQSVVSQVAALREQMESANSGAKSGESDETPTV
ncbi:MAG: hypothetical protein KatS3mg066_2976 [Fischerella sp.]|nr:MAG: hypothetical protein KatS3mg066_2976 [Fischerella sp.]